MPSETLDEPCKKQSNESTVYCRSHTLCTVYKELPNSLVLVRPLQSKAFSTSFTTRVTVDDKPVKLLY